jgi:hypothetical protein
MGRAAAAGFPSPGSTNFPLHRQLAPSSTVLLFLPLSYPTIDNEVQDVPVHSTISDNLVSERTTIGTRALTPRFQPDASSNLIPSRLTNRESI